MILGDALLLATASQDSFVRVYRLRVKKEHAINNDTGNLNFVETEEVDFFMDKVRIGLCLETVLMGHENWAYGVAFHRSARGKQTQGCRELSKFLPSIFKRKIMGVTNRKEKV